MPSTKELVMHEMWVGVDAASGGLVWHVLTTDTATTLCGQPRQHEGGAGHASTDRHCLECMTSFQDIMQAPAGA
ncbi:hypothetical protein ACFCWG_39230 [Streptomyces sp. NPDC056390]|uniref:hypothetical protein n=1 Tax=Streptomyces sp. NPDC056390 TaxID=3345806 RepID=UPI0035E3AB90